MLKVLFICTGNTCRSPMAEILLREKIRQAGFEDKITVTSAGLMAGGEFPASHGAHAAMLSRGLNLAEHLSKQLTSQMIDEADLILTMTAGHKAAVISAVPKAKNKVYTLAEYAGETMDIADPFGGNSAIYEAAAKQIDSLLEKMWNKLQF